MCFDRDDDDDDELVYQDWGKHVDVVGTLAPPAQDFSDYKPPDDLDSFLKAGDPPVFIGFGSMVIADTSSLVKIILQAATRTKTRVVLQVVELEYSMYKHSYFESRDRKAFLVNSLFAKKKSGNSENKVGPKDCNNHFVLHI